MSETPRTSEKPPTAKGPAATTAYVVLLVDGELLERASTATHLRKSGFEVIRQRTAMRRDASSIQAM